MGWVGLGWVGLGWLETGRVGLGWVGLESRLGRAGLMGRGGGRCQGGRGRAPSGGSLQCKTKETAGINADDGRCKQIRWRERAT